MKKYIALSALTVAAWLAAPASASAQDAAPTNAPAATAPAKKHGLPFHGKVTAVDTTAMTVTVGSKTYKVTSATKISKLNQPATLADIPVGETITGSYKEVEGKLNASTIHIGAPGKNKTPQ